MDRQRYDILDGLRGVAAIMVVIFHISEAFSYDPVEKVLNHGFLCVDFFFVLSGFVVAHAYQARMKSGRMTRWQFIKARLIRLQPMIVFATLLGALLFYLQESPVYPGIKDASLGYLMANVLAGVCMLPIPPEWNVRANGEMLLLNIPQWSMFFEYIANILFCLIAFRLGRKGLVLLVAAFGLLLADSALTLNIFGNLPTEGYPLSLNAGWSGTLEHFYVGIARVGFAFFAGMLLYHLYQLPCVARLSQRCRGHFLVCSLLVIGMVCVPQIGGYKHPLYDGIFNLACVVLLFPFIVWLGAGGTLRSVASAKWCTYLGRISYPLYLVHYPIVYLFFGWIETHRHAPLAVIAWTCLAVVILSVALAHAAMVVWDEPIRQWLSKKWNK